MAENNYNNNRALFGNMDEETPEETQARILREGIPEQPSVENQVQADAVNDDAKSPNLKTKSELEQDEAENRPQVDPALSDLRANIERYKEQMNKPSEAQNKDKVMNWLTGIGQATNVLNRQQGRDTEPVKYWGSQGKKQEDAAKAKKLTELQKLQKMYQDYNTAQKKSKGTTKDKEGKIFQTRSGLVQIQQGKPVSIYKDEYMQKTGEIKEKSLDLRKDKFKQAIEVKDRLSDKEVESINNLDEGARILDQIDNQLKHSDVADDLGPYASRLEEASRYIPGTERSEAFVKTQQLVGIQLADYVKSISGAAVSEQEAQRLLKNIPNMTDKPAAFKAKIDQFRQELKEAKKTYLENIGRQKKGAKKFMESGKAKTHNQSSEAEKWARKNMDDPRAIEILKRLGK